MVDLSIDEYDNLLGIWKICVYCETTITDPYHGVIHGCKCLSHLQKCPVSRLREEQHSCSLEFKLQLVTNYVKKTFSTDDIIGAYMKYMENNFLSLMNERNTSNLTREECNLLIMCWRVCVRCEMKKEKNINQSAEDVGYIFPCQCLFHDGCPVPPVRSFHNPPECSIQFKTEAVTNYVRKTYKTDIVRTAFKTYMEENLPGLNNVLPSSTDSTCEHYDSKFQMEFEQVKPIGHGSFGVVFKAMHQLAQVFYAVKRIAVADSERAIEVALREVRAMAKLDHPGIIRFHDTWKETPPPGWQKKIDENLLKTIREDEELSSDQQNSVQSASGNSSGTVTKPPNDEKRDHSEAYNSSENARALGTKMVLDSTTDGDGELFLSSTATSWVYIYIKMELCQEQTLHSWLTAHNRPEDRARAKMQFWFNQLCNALSYIHRQGLIHRDVKPANIFFTSENKLKIGDLGLVCEIKKRDVSAEVQPVEIDSENGVNHTAGVGTPSYMSPEQLQNKPYTSKVDVYALGLIFCELIIPFGSMMERAMTLSALRKGDVPEDVKDEKDREMVLWLTSLDPEARPSCDDILEHLDD